MFKSYIFASLYTVIGMSGWGAISTISTEDTSITAIKQVAANALRDEQSEPIPKSLYRWKDHNGNWQYGQIPSNEVNANYQRELAELRSLPREVLPTQALSATEEELSLIEVLSRLPLINKLISHENETDEDKTAELNQLLAKVKKMQLAEQKRLENAGRH